MCLCTAGLSWVKAKVKAYYRLKATIILGGMFYVKNLWKMISSIWELAKNTITLFLGTFDSIQVCVSCRWGYQFLLDGPIRRLLYFLHSQKDIIQRQAWSLLFSLHVICCHCCMWYDWNMKSCNIDNKLIHRESLHKMYQFDICIEMEMCDPVRLHVWLLM